MKASLAILLFSALAASANPLVPREEVIRLGFVPPEYVRIHHEDLGLDDGQRDRLRILFEAAQAAMPGLQAAIEEQGQALENAVRSPAPKADEAEAVLNRLLEAEAAVKRLELRTILTVNEVLSAEQRSKALELAKRDAEAEAPARALAERLRIAIESLGVEPTQAIRERGEQLKLQLDEGRFAAALEALEAAAKDIGLDAAATEEVVDFSSFDPGVIEQSQLMQRYEQVEQRVQRVVGLPLLRQLVQAHAALEAAKDAQDAIAAGRILTWAEGVLP